MKIFIGAVAIHRTGTNPYHRDDTNPYAERSRTSQGSQSL